MPQPAAPLTTVDKAALCDALLPPLAALKEAVWAVAAKAPEAPPAPEAVSLAHRLARDVHRLLQGEPAGRYLGTTARQAPATRFALALSVAMLESAVQAFRRRYFGHHPALGRPGWHLSGADPVKAARSLLPREAMQASDPAPQSPAMQRLRQAIAARIEELNRG